VTDVEVRDAAPEDAAYIRAALEAGFGGTLVAGHGELMDAAAHPALIAWRDGERTGLLIHRATDETTWEIVSINTTTPAIGAGAALLAAVRERARAAGVLRIWLVTTNDNTHALRFYQRNGYDLVALHRDAVAEARRLKPTIPLELDGIPVRHELVLATTP
jgi:GNAT superfamily N-acetyltransferase